MLRVSLLRALRLAIARNRKEVSGFVLRVSYTRRRPIVGAGSDRLRYERTQGHESANKQQ